MEMFELYIDDFLMQTYIRQPGSGKVGFLVCNAQAELSDLRAWTMSLPAAGGVAPRSAGKTDKTLVSWVTLANTAQRGGSALTIQRGVAFDAIVFGEKQPGKWMAGSDYFARTQDQQDANPAEHADAGTLIQIAIVYAGGRISIYRDGAPYASYPAINVELLKRKDNLAVFGLRHQGAGSGQTFQGSIEDARIYDRALTADQIKALRPNQRSKIKPYAWWSFEKGMETDRMGRFPFNSLDGGARIEGGRLVLESSGATLLATAKPILTPARTAGPSLN
jgi:beta-fructofuranosidase